MEDQGRNGFFNKEGGALTVGRLEDRAQDRQRHSYLTLQLLSTGEAVRGRLPNTEWGALREVAW